MSRLDGAASPASPTTPTTPQSPASMHATRSPTQDRQDRQDTQDKRHKSRCLYCGKELANKRNLELHHNICKHSPSKHRRSFRCESCPSWIGYSEQARTEHAKTKAHLANTHLANTHLANTHLADTHLANTRPSRPGVAVPICADAEASGSEDVDVVGPHPPADAFTLSNHQAACLLLSFHRGCPSA